MIKKFRAVVTTGLLLAAIAGITAALSGGSAPVAGPGEPACAAMNCWIM